MKIIISPWSQRLRNAKPNPKNYPFWKELVGLLEPQIDLLQVGVEGEEQLTKSFVKGLKMPQLRLLLDQYDTFISVDNFFPHFAHHYNFHGIVIWGQSNPKIFGYPENLNLLKHPKYLRKDQFGLWESCERNEEVFVEPEKVAEAIFKINNI